MARIATSRDDKNSRGGWSSLGPRTGGKFGGQMGIGYGDPRRVWGGDGIGIPIPEPDLKIYMFIFK
ncbi:unnamed protein product [Prunus armeniaca]